MLAIASKIIICLILAALLGFIIGYILGKNSCKNEDCTETMTHDHEAAEAIPAPEAVSGQEPLLLSGPRNGIKDNLTRIKGIGVKIDEALNAIGIYHFDQIANWGSEHVAWVDKNIAFPGRVEREQWVEQAKKLAAGEETEFSKRVDEGKVASSKKV